MQKKRLFGKNPGAAMAAMLALAPMGAGHAQAPAHNAAVSPDLAKERVLYLIGYSHLDTEWRWSYPQVIREFLPNTLHQNFSLFDKYPDYTFNWTGSNRYRLMKEYYPEDYARLKRYVAAGRWFPNGSSMEEGDVDMPSEESIIRQVLYGNQFFRREFGVASNEFMIPDCFGFPASLPSVLAHCGLTGFSTQKLTWGSAIGIPFNVGVWEGPDGRSVVAALNPGDYTGGVDDDLSHDTGWISRLDDNAKQSGLAVDYHYYGVGDRGGAPRESSVQGMERSLAGGGPIHVVSAKASQMFSDLTPDEAAKLPHYKGDILLIHHSAGSLSSEAAMKRWNRENELLGDATERASLAADWLGALPYDKARISDAWQRFLPGQFHDLMAGTAMPQAYEFAWNDQILALNEFAGVLQEAAGGVARGLDTRAQGVPLTVYNPLSIARQDVVEAGVTFPQAAPRAVRVFGPDGHEVPSQIKGRVGASLTVLFSASVPSVGFATYDVRPAASASPADPALKVSRAGVENARYRVRLDANGDVASIYDKAARREMLLGPARLAYQHENPAEYPAWNMDWEDQQRPPRGYVDGPPTVRVVEAGPVRVALQVERRSEGSRFVQTLRLAAGSAGDRIEFANLIDWKGRETALKAVFPLTVANPLATYNWDLGTIQRANNNDHKFEVPSHKWFDLTDTSGRYGVSILDTGKYGSDKPDDNTVRLTLLYTPGVRGGFQDQATQDWGRHEFVYAVQGHAGDWRQGQTQWQAARLNQPLLAFQTPAHAGPLGRAFSLMTVSTPQVQVEALKQAEESREVIVRLNELSGRPVHAALLSAAAPILSVREVDGQERPVAASGGAVALRRGKLVFDMTPYRPRAFALTLGRTASRLSAPGGTPLPLPYNRAVTSSGGAGGGDFDGHGGALPAELLPASLVSDGVRFRLGPTGDARKNAVSCRGQALPLPAGTHRRVYLLAASANGDTTVTFTAGRRPVHLTIQGWDGFIGQWDDRRWNGPLRELTYDWPNSLAGLTPGYIKPAPVAWYADHKRLAGGANDPYRFCYLFRYAIDVPDDAKTLTLPRNAEVHILAATVARNPNADALPAQPLYGRLDHTDAAFQSFAAAITQKVLLPGAAPQVDPVFQSTPVQTFDGTGNGIASRDIARLPTGSDHPWTINQFVYLSAPPEELTVLGGFGSGADEAGAQRYLIKFHDGIHFWGSSVDITTGVPFDLGKWQMITLSYDGKTLTIYKNGQALKTAEITLGDADNVVKIGAPGPWPKGGRFAGKIAGFAIWNRAMSEETIRSLEADMPKN